MEINGKCTLFSVIRALVALIAYRERSRLVHNTSNHTHIIYISTLDFIFLLRCRAIETYEERVRTTAVCRNDIVAEHAVITKYI